MSNQTPVSPSTSPQAPVQSSDSRMMAMLAHLLLIFTWFIGPLIIYLIKKDQDKFVAFHALQAVYWSIALWVAAIAASVATFFLCGLGGVAVGVVGLIFVIMTLIKAYNGEWAEHPIVGKWAMGSIH